MRSVCDLDKSKTISLVAKKYFSCFLINMTKVRSTAKLPLKHFMGKGSCDKRMRYARKLNHDFFEKIKPELKTGEISPVLYRKVLKSLIPEKINVHISPLSEVMSAHGAKGAVTMIGDDEFTGFKISLPYIKSFGKRNKNAKIPTRIISTMMHENYHLFSGISNPKYLARCNFKDLREFKVYEENLYGKTKGQFGVKKIINIMKYLKTISIEERINFLQNCRYRLTDEHNAFAEGARYSMGKYNYVPFEFYTQISFLEMLLYLNLQKVRKRNKLEFGNQ